MPSSTAEFISAEQAGDGSVVRAAQHVMHCTGRQIEPLSQPAYHPTKSPIRSRLTQQAVQPFPNLRTVIARATRMRVVPEPRHVERQV
jgi:hypothetical protein